MREIIERMEQLGESYIGSQFGKLKGDYFTVKV
jgi:hypothetical protein